MHRRCCENYPVFRFTAATNKKFPLILEIVAKVDNKVPSSPASWNGPKTLNMCNRNENKFLTFQPS